jgi:hypothetical protein
MIVSLAYWLRDSLLGFALFGLWIILDGIIGVCRHYARKNHN